MSGLTPFIKDPKRSRDSNRRRLGQQHSKQQQQEYLIIQEGPVNNFNPKGPFASDQTEASAVSDQLFLRCPPGRTIDERPGGRCFCKSDQYVVQFECAPRNDPIPFNVDTLGTPFTYYGENRNGAFPQYAPNRTGS